MKRDVLKIRAEAVRRRKQKSMVRKCILKGIHASRQRSNVQQQWTEVEGLAPWQRHTRAVQNNLGL